MKEALEAIKNYQSKSTIVRTTIHDTDVFSYLEDEKYAYVNFFENCSWCCYTSTYS